MSQALLTDMNGRRIHEVGIEIIITIRAPFIIFSVGCRGIFTSVLLCLLLFVFFLFPKCFWLSQLLLKPLFCFFLSMRCTSMGWETELLIAVCGQEQFDESWTLAKWIPLPANQAKTQTHSPSSCSGAFQLKLYASKLICSRLATSPQNKTPLAILWLLIQHCCYMIGWFDDCANVLI